MTNFIDDVKIARLFVDNDAGRPLFMVSIDCGHGGLVGGVYQTAGKQWDFGDFHIYEGVQNRAIGKLLAQKFINNHISYNFTTISNYDDPLKQRMEYFARMVKTYPNHKHLLISIHADATEKESNARGCSLYSTPGITDSDYASNLFIPYLYDIGLRVRIYKPSDLNQDHEANFYVLRKAEEAGAMGLLCELGFMTNREDAQYIMTPEFHDKASDALLKGTQSVIQTLKDYGNIRKI